MHTFIFYIYTSINVFFKNIKVKTFKLYFLRQSTEKMKVCAPNFLFCLFSVFLFCVDGYQLGDVKTFVTSLLGGANESVVCQNGVAKKIIFAPLYIRPLASISCEGNSTKPKVFNDNINTFHQSAPALLEENILTDELQTIICSSQNNNRRRQLFATPSICDSSESAIDTASADLDSHQSEKERKSAIAKATLLIGCGISSMQSATELVTNALGGIAETGEMISTSHDDQGKLNLQIDIGISTLVESMEKNNEIVNNEFRNLNNAFFSNKQQFSDAILAYVGDVTDLQTAIKAEAYEQEVAFSVDRQMTLLDTELTGRSRRIKQMRSLQILNALDENCNQDIVLPKMDIDLKDNRHRLSINFLWEIQSIKDGDTVVAYEPVGLICFWSSQARWSDLILEMKDRILTTPEEYIITTNVKTCFRFHYYRHPLFHQSTQDQTFQNQSNVLLQKCRDTIGIARNNGTGILFKVDANSLQRQQSDLLFHMVDNSDDKLASRQAARRWAYDQIDNLRSITTDPNHTLWAEDPSGTPEQHMFNLLLTLFVDGLSSVVGHATRVYNTNGVRAGPMLIATGYISNVLAEEDTLRINNESPILINNNDYLVIGNKNITFGDVNTTNMLITQRDTQQSAPLYTEPLLFGKLLDPDHEIRRYVKTKIQNGSYDVPNMYNITHLVRYLWESTIDIGFVCYGPMVPMIESWTETGMLYDLMDVFPTHLDSHFDHTNCTQTVASSSRYIRSFLLGAFLGGWFPTCGEQTGFEIYQPAENATEPTPDFRVVNRTDGGVTFVRDTLFVRCSSDKIVNTVKTSLYSIQGDVGILAPLALVSGASMPTRVNENFTQMLQNHYKVVDYDPITYNISYEIQSQIQKLKDQSAESDTRIQDAIGNVSSGFDDIQDSIDTVADLLIQAGLLYDEAENFFNASQVILDAQEIGYPNSPSTDGCKSIRDVEWYNFINPLKVKETFECLFSLLKKFTIHTLLLFLGLIVLLLILKNVLAKIRGCCCSLISSLTGFLLQQCCILFIFSAVVVVVLSFLGSRE